PHTPRDAALAQLGLDQFASIENIKARYKSLAKKHHPDANGGSKNAEKKFVAIQEAYNLLINDAVA
ncbi:MAG TPA: molecular chaperone DnaJ, partial [Alphaproteobacteria bacterium]|nr:molecular chaperone DnaJ [Alphaproteobacteria bacterium]